jgi:sugar/nucleoside kinase (ribokinase family)
MSSRGSSPRVLTVGETMALLDPLEEGDPMLGFRFRLRVAGAESNFAIALARLGVSVAWVSRLGADPLGDLVAQTIAAEGVDVRWVRREAAAPTGVFFKLRSAGRTRVLYYRRGSAASRLALGDVPDEALEQVALVHLTGITMAISATARGLVIDVARRAHERGITVCFDPNYRPALWSGAAQAAQAQSDVLAFADWYLCGLEEGNLLFGTASAAELSEAVRARGVRGAAIRVGVEGALVTHGDLRHVPVAQRTAVVDEVGAGDGFAAGFAYGLLRGWHPTRCAATGNLIAAAAVTGTGDWETFPRIDEVRDELDVELP